MIYFYEKRLRFKLSGCLTPVLGLLQQDDSVSEAPGSPSAPETWRKLTCPRADPDQGSPHTEHWPLVGDVAPTPEFSVFLNIEVE